MKSTDRSNKRIKKKHIVYCVLLALAFCWPWIFVGGMSEGDLVDVLSLGMFPVILISGVIVYRETKTHPSAYRWGFALALATTLLLVWIIPAVGIFGRSGDPADLIYFGVLAIGVIGALVSHFRPRGIGLYAVCHGDWTDVGGGERADCRMGLQSDIEYFFCCAMGRFGVVVLACCKRTSKFIEKRLNLFTNAGRK